MAANRILSVQVFTRRLDIRLRLPAIGRLHHTGLLLDVANLGWVVVEVTSWGYGAQMLVPFVFCYRDYNKTKREVEHNLRTVYRPVGISTVFLDAFQRFVEEWVENHPSYSAVFGPNCQTFVADAVAFLQGISDSSSDSDSDSDSDDSEDGSTSA